MKFSNKPIHHHGKKCKKRSNKQKPKSAQLRAEKKNITELQCAYAMAYNRRKATIQEHQTDAIISRIFYEMLKNQIPNFKPYLDIVRNSIQKMTVPDKETKNVFPF